MLTILFLHGWGGNSDSFAPLTRYFASRCRVLCPTLPCPPETVATLDDYVTVLEKYLQDKQVTQCAVVAHSFGARLVALLNARQPQLFTHIVLTGAAGLPPRWSLRVWWRIRWYKLRRRLGLHPQGGSTDYQKLTPNGKITFQNIIHRDLTREFAQITVPTLLVWGQKDRATPLSICRRLQKLLPQAQVKVYRHDDHFAYLHQSARFINDLNDFLPGDF